MYTISEVAKKLDISAHTLRYYEKEGIVIPARDAHEVRVYDDSHIRWLGFVKKLRETKMPIAQIKKYAHLLQEGDHTTAARLRLLEKHHDSIQKQLHDLIETEKMLERKIVAYKEIMKQTEEEEGSGAL
ncbi:MerR family transcriptional regulator [Mechercharimyces sp. CAU 1602]|uniref:MerR family transcriptional regulator n=1 Tax=Mechercharimyces sp. CAU 1602 TaxID=2973933 RepID=UPI0021637DFF|nr:MerR family transcriptional regulator [Mechercharimyces sp. CAU 1602]MCS1351094.1 MerR family transcriptional regulator [Mechercharimyces sp. CAU 1602]